MGILKMVIDRTDILRHKYLLIFNVYQEFFIKTVPISKQNDLLKFYF